MEYNSYIYPFQSFNDLSNKNYIGKFNETSDIDINYLVSFLNSIPITEIPIHGDSIAEKCFNIFLNRDIRFGPERFISEDKNYWIERFNFFITQDLPIQMSILGFPYKIPVLLKTDRIYPDLGEIFALKRLYDICKTVQRVYTPGSCITIFTEGGFGKFNHIPKLEYRNYEKYLELIVNLFEWNKELRFIRLELMEEIFPEFNKTFNTTLNEIQARFKIKDHKFMKKYDQIIDSIVRIVNTKILLLSETDLMSLYDEGINNKVRNKKIDSNRTYINKQAQDYSLKYIAYLQTRDTLDFINKMVPNSIKLSVAPKPKRLGIIPINRESKILPYHGVPVYYPKKNIVKIEYLIDIKRKNKEYKIVYLKEDKDKQPFFYIDISE